MTNKLTRSGYSYTIPETPYQPGRPGYWVHSTYTVTTPATIRKFSSGQGASGMWASVSGGLPANALPSESATVNSPDGFVWVTAESSSGGGGAATTTTYTISTWVPPVPAVPASPSRRIDSPPPGWTAFARSQASVTGNARAEFYVSAQAAGVAIGLAPLAAPAAGYGHIRHGLMFADGAVRNLNTGADCGSYTDASKAEVRVEQGTVSFWVGGVQVGSEASGYSLGEPLHLSAVLFGNGDFVNSPVLVQINAGTSTAALSKLSAFGGDHNASYSAARLGPLTARSSVASRSRAGLPALMGASADRPYGGSQASLAGLSVSSYGGALAGAPTAESFAQLAAATATSVVLVGGTGTAGATLGAMSGLSADRPYGASRAIMAPAQALSYTLSTGTAFLLDDATWLVDVPMLGTTVNDARMTAAVSVDVPTTAAGQLQTVELRDHVTLDVVFSFTGEALADARDVIWFDVPLDVPGAFMDAWSVNADTGGSSTYDNFAFNSLACIGGRYFGAGEGGIFELVGDTDDGQPVRASLDLGLRNFGTSNLKTVDTCFLGMAATGHLYVKVLAEGNEHLYKTRSFSPQMQAQRVVFGRGLRTNYVGLQIFNEGGADFELDGLEFALTDLSRRV